MRFDPKNKNKTGLEYRINFFIINEAVKYIAKGINVNDFFSVQGDKIKISYTRVRKIINGENFEFNDNLALEIEELFKIDKSYFRTDRPQCIQIGKISKEEWENFFEVRNANADDTDINKELIKCFDNWESIKGVHIDSALYNICYFLKYGKPNLCDTERVLDSLNNIGDDLSKWNSLDDNKLNKVCELMDKHSEYIKAYLRYKKFNN